jgi:hypothetical protein
MERGAQEEVRREVVEEFFYSSPVFVDGEFLPAPRKAIEKREELLEGWFKDFPVEGTRERPSVMLFPWKIHGVWAGYVVQKATYYPPPQTIDGKIVGND